MKTIGLLLVSNVFMTMAWYGHLKFKTTALWKVVLVSWLIALVERCFQVPANRMGALPVFRRPAQDHPGGHHPGGLLRVLDGLHSRTAEVELRRGFPDDRRGGVFHLCVPKPCAAAMKVASMPTRAGCPAPIRQEDKE
jgi:hypothetical protein